MNISVTPPIPTIIDTNTNGEVKKLRVFDAMSARAVRGVWEGGAARTGRATATAAAAAAVGPWAVRGGSQGETGR